jgi:DNA-binding transcriptional ArsR family regulator
MNTELALDALRALSQEYRLASFRQLIQAGPAGLSVGELRERVGIPPATLSAHLNVLRSAGLVNDVREGRVIRVRADFARMNALLAYLTENCCAGAACTPAAECCPEPTGVAS